MSDLIIINTPTNKGFKEVYGQPIDLLIGDTTCAFLLQYSDADNKPTLLTHYASGYKVASLDTMRQRQKGKRLAISVIAQLTLHEIVDRNGLQTVLERLNNAPIINLCHRDYEAVPKPAKGSQST